MLIYSKDLTKSVTKLLIQVPNVTFFYPALQSWFYIEENTVPIGMGGGKGREWGEQPGNTQRTSGEGLEKKYLFLQNCCVDNAFKSISSKLWAYCWLLFLLSKLRGIFCDKHGQSDPAKLASAFGALCKLARNYDFVLEWGNSVHVRDGASKWIRLWTRNVIDFLQSLACVLGC